jgi:hypothetical protein
LLLNMERMKIQLLMNGKKTFKKYHYYVLRKSAQKTSPTIKEFILLQDREVSIQTFERYIDMSEQKGTVHE